MPIDLMHAVTDQSVIIYERSVGPVASGYVLTISPTVGITIGGVGQTLTTPLSIAGTTTTGFSIGSTATDGLAITGVCGDAIHISGANTVTGIHISGNQVDNILIDVDAAADNGLKVAVDDGITLGVGLNFDRTGTTGIITTAISIDTDGTTAIDIAAGFTGVTGIQIAGTASGDGILISGACADAIHISGTNTVAGLHISGDQVDFILLDVDAAAGNGVKIAVDDGITLGVGLALVRTGTTGIVTTGISIDTDGTTAISIGAGFTGTTGISIAGTSTNAIAITGSATTAINVLTGTFGTGIALAGTLTTGMTIGACTTGISLTDTVTTGISIAGNATDGIKIAGGTVVDAIELGSCTNGVNFNGTITNLVNIAVAATTTYFILANATGGCVDATGTVGAMAGRILIHVGAVDYAIPYYALT